MSEEKKPGSQGPVVIRKGHVKPPQPGEKIEPPQEERLEPAPAARTTPRPLWQRVAEDRSGGAGRTLSARRPRPAARPAARRSPAARWRPRRAPRTAARRARPRRPSAGQPPHVPEPPPAPELAVPDEGSFADMLATSGSAAPRRRFQVGEKVAGKIIQLGHDVAFLELGSGVAEAMIEVAELKDADGNVTAREGDILDAVVIHADDRGVLVSKGHARTTRDHAREAVIEAAQNGLPVEGLVKAANKGGLEVEVHGVRAFCPMSQIDVRFVGDPATFVGQKLLFKVQRADARDCVLSRRALLEEERRREGARDARAARARRGLRGRRDERAGLRRVRGHRRRRGARPRLRAGLGSRVEAAGPADGRRRGAGPGAPDRRGSEEGRAHRPLGEGARARGRSRSRRRRGEKPARPAPPAPPEGGRRRRRHRGQD